jgi:hypothetical protein
MYVEVGDDDVTREGSKREGNVLLIANNTKTMRFFETAQKIPKS